MTVNRLITLGVVMATLTGCAGVPKFYGGRLSPPMPTVSEVVHHVSCEIKSATAVKTPPNTINARFFGDHYFITVLLTLKVDDNIDLTPSLVFISPLTSAMENVTTTVAGDIGRARERTFTVTYTMDSAKLEQLKCDGFTNGNRAYRLDSRLGLAEVIQDGLQVIDQDQGSTRAFSTPADKIAPSFGSLVQFTITNSITSLGPVWTLKRFKGAGGATGLLNGKRLDTDSVLLTFAPQFGVSTTPKPHPNTPRFLAADANVASAAATREMAKAQSGAAAAHAAQLSQAAVAAQGRRANFAARLSPVEKQRLDDQAGQTSAAAAEAQAIADKAANNAIEAETLLNSATAHRAVVEDEESPSPVAGQSDGVKNAQALQQTMLLQNLLSAAPH